MLVKYQVYISTVMRSLKNRVAKTKKFYIKADTHTILTQLYTYMVRLISDSVQSESIN